MLYISYISYIKYIPSHILLYIIFILSSMSQGLRTCPSQRNLCKQKTRKTLYYCLQFCPDFPPFVLFYFSIFFYLQAEKRGEVCRDHSIEGLKFFANLFRAPCVL